MRRSLTVGIALPFLIGMVLAGCGNSYIPMKERGYVSLILSGTAPSRTWTNSTAQEEADTYHVYIYNDANVFWQSLTLGANSITVLTGTYNVLVLGGKYGSSGTSLLGADRITGIEVEAGSTVSRSVNLETIPSFGFTVPNQIAAGSAIPVSVSFESPIPSITPSGGYGVRSSGDNNFVSKGTIPLTLTEGVWSGSGTIDSPILAGELNVYLTTEGGLKSHVYYQDSDFPALSGGVPKTLRNLFDVNVNWYFPVSGSFATNSPIYADLFKEVVVFNSNEGAVSITIEWSE